MTNVVKTIRWGGDDPFTHMLVVGPTRCGKTATVLKPIIVQILKAKMEGKKVGLSVIEPKGDMAQMVKEVCDKIGTPCVYIDPLYPTKSDAINVMSGEKSDVAEATVAVLKSLFGKQEAFFATVQELTARKVTLLLKELYGDNMYITDVLENLRDENILKQNVELLRQRGSDPELVAFFDNELLHGKDQEKYRQLVIGLRSQLENITSNEHLKPIITRKSTINLDEHFEKGGVLAVNTALGKLGRAGDAFGQFIAMHLQLATFRRKGTERTRIPHYLIIDEYSRYINPDVERFLSIAAEYRVAGIFAIQSLAQLEVEAGQLSGRAMKQAILTSTRNKIVFGGLSAGDARELSIEFGKDLVVEREKVYGGSFLPQINPKSFRDTEKEKDRFRYTQLIDGLPRLHYVHKLLQNGHPQPPGVAKGEYLPRNIREYFRTIGEQEQTDEFNEEKVEEPFTINGWISQKARKIKREHEEMQRKRVRELLSDNPFDDVKTKEDSSKAHSSDVPLNEIVLEGEKRTDTGSKRVAETLGEKADLTKKEITFNSKPKQNNHVKEDTFQHKQRETHGQKENDILNESPLHSTTQSEDKQEIEVNSNLENDFSNTFTDDDFWQFQ